MCLLRIRLKVLLSHQNSSDQAYIFTTQVKKMWKPFHKSQFSLFFTRVMGEPSTVKYANNRTINISKFVSCEKLGYVKVREPDSELHVVFSRNCLGLVVGIVMTYFSIFLSWKPCTRQKLK